MQMFSDFVILFVAGVAAMFYFDPRVRSTWSPPLRIAMFALIGGFAVGQLLLKGMTGKGLDDRIADQAAALVCSIAVISEKCPTEIQRKAEQLTDFDRRQTEMAILIQSNRRNGVRPTVRCPFPVRSMFLEQGKCKPYPCSYAPDGDNGEDGEHGETMFMYVSAGDITATCTGFGLPAPKVEIAIPKGTQVCSHAGRDFSCW